MAPEIWSPATGKWTKLAPMAIPRTYHSVALLLPDGRVFVGGGGLCGDCTTNHLDGQIFTPPYLLNPDGSARTRPKIVTAPATAAAGSTIKVTTGAPVTKFSLMRMSTVTHTVNTDQRRIPVTATSVSGQHRFAEVAGGSRRAGAGQLPAVRDGRQRDSQRRLDDQDQLTRLRYHLESLCRPRSRDT